MSDYIDIAHFEIYINTHIAQGSFGEVFVGRNTQHGKEEKIVAKKCKNNKKIAQREIEILRQLQQHPNIVQIYTSEVKQDYVWIIMELCELENLEKYFVSHDPPLSTQLVIMKQSADAVEFMHNKKDPKIVHRDLKPENILLKKLPGTKPRAIVKIADFGLAKAFSMPDGSSSVEHNTYAGSPPYMAPELCKEDPNRKYTRAVDVFAMGLMFLAMIRHTSGNKWLNSCKDERGTQTFGVEMRKSYREGTPLEPVAKQKEGDSVELRVVKESINAMTKYNSKQRIKMQALKIKLDKLLEDTAVNIEILFKEETVRDFPLPERKEVIRAVRPRQIKAEDGIINFIGRDLWKAKESLETYTKLKKPLKYVIVSHSGTVVKVDTTEECIAEVRNIQRLSMEDKEEGFTDIIYNVLVGNDGMIYEGRGIDNKGAAAKDWNELAISVGFIGRYVEKLPTAQAIGVAKFYLNYLVDIGVLEKDFTLYLLCDVREKFKKMFDFALYSEVTTWKGNHPDYTWKWRPGPVKRSEEKE